MAGAEMSNTDLEIAATRELAESSLRLMRDATAMECASIVRAYKERHCKMPCMGWCACDDLLDLITRRYPEIRTDDR